MSLGYSQQRSKGVANCSCVLSTVHRLHSAPVAESPLREQGTLRKISAMSASCKDPKPSRTARVQGHLLDYLRQWCLFQVYREGSCMICNPMRTNLL